jgi:ribosomal protein S18 acetylase RimI-like enzyme
VRVTVRDITKKNIEDIPEPCRSCLYWENSAAKSGQPSRMDKAEHEAEKRNWFLNTRKEFGNCGKILYADDTPVGYAQYACESMLPNSREYGAKKLGTAEEKIVFISCLYVSDEKFRGKGLGERLLDEVVADLRNRGFRTVETFARKSSANNPSGPMQFYLKKGFHVEEQLNTDPDFALVRLNL